MSALMTVHNPQQQNTL